MALSGGDEDWIALHGGAILVARNGGAVIGALVLCFDHAETFVRPELRAHGLVADLVVAERARGQGVGRVLLREAERRTRAAGLGAMTISALIGNDPAVRLYTAFGFEPRTVEMIKRLDLDATSVPAVRAVTDATER